MLRRALPGALRRRWWLLGVAVAAVLAAAAASGLIGISTVDEAALRERRRLALSALPLPAGARELERGHVDEGGFGEAHHFSWMLRRRRRGG